MKNFDNKRVFITGGSSGIGLYSAILFAGQGAHVAIFARNKARLEKAMEQIRATSAKDRNLSIYILDVADNAQVKSVMDKAVLEFGVPDILINCAGRARPMNFEDVTYEQFDQTMKINLYGARNTVAALLPYMKKNGGCIINVSSVAGLIGVFGYTDYCASKFALIGFSEALKSELKKYGILVSVLCPPDTDTPGFEEENITKPPETKAIGENAGLMQPKDVARAMLEGIKKEKFIIIPGFDSKLSWLIKRLFPQVVDFVMNRAIKKAQS